MSRVHLWRQTSLHGEKTKDNTSWNCSCLGWISKCRCGMCNACCVESRLRSCGRRVSQQLNRATMAAASDVVRRNFADKQIRTGNPTNGRYTRTDSPNNIRCVVMESWHGLKGKLGKQLRQTAARRYRNKQTFHPALPLCTVRQICRVDFLILSFFFLSFFFWSSFFSTRKLVNPLGPLFHAL